MIERYTGEPGKRRLIEALLAHVLFEGNQDLAAEIAAIFRLQEHAPGDALMHQGAADNTMAILLSGNVAVYVNGREVAQRHAGQTVGEMALIDPSARRSATVVAIEETVAGWVDESDFSRLADKYPRLWRRLAVELADRLRQRGKLVPSRNTVPHIFIGSSTEALPVARAVHRGLVDPSVTVSIWTHGVFEASRTNIENLETEAAKSDFAVLVVSPDDKAIVRDAERDVPRDNVVFELGLFMGALSRGRTFIVQPKSVDLKLPTDLLGIGVLPYDTDPAAKLDACVAAACSEIRKLVAQRGGK